jgi:O-antigen/teichoic acid export membrane protein
VASSATTIYSTVWTWHKKAFWTLADQALFSGGNFLFNVLLARWLSSADYGAYSLAFAVFLMIAALHSAILVEPMMVFGAGKYYLRFSPYIRQLVQGHLLFIVPVSVLLLIIGLILGYAYSPAVERAMSGLALGSTGILLFWLLRRVFYVIRSPGLSACVSGVYFLSLIGSLCCLKAANALSERTAFLDMGVASLIASALTFVMLPKLLKQRGDDPKWSETAADHWEYGRWALCTAGIQWFPSQIYFALLPKWMGLEAAGALRALLNLAMPVLHSIAALSMLLLPTLVRQRRIGSVKFTQTIFAYLALFLAGTAIYALAIWTSKARLIELVYAGRYSAYTGLPLTLVALLPFSSSVGAVLGNALRALEQPDLLFWCYVASAISAVTIGIPLAASRGVVGALMGLQLSSLVTVLMMFWLYRRSVANHEQKTLQETVVR